MQFVVSRPSVGWRARIAFHRSNIMYFPGRAQTSRWTRSTALLSLLWCLGNVCKSTLAVKHKDTRSICGEIRLHKNKGVTWDSKDFTNKTTFKKTGPHFAQVDFRREVLYMAGDVKLTKTLDGICSPQNVGWVNGRHTKRWGIDWHGDFWNGDRQWLFIDAGCADAEFRVCTGEYVFNSKDYQGSTSDIYGEFHERLFLITNKEYSYANLALTKSKRKRVTMNSPFGTVTHELLLTTYEPRIYDNQFWRLEEDKNHRGYFRIWNFDRDMFRLMPDCSRCSSGTDYDLEVIGTDQRYRDAQLWKFVHRGDGYYWIVNKHYTHHKLGKYNAENYAVSMTTSRDFGEQQLWKLTPRFRAEVQRHILWHTDNRFGKIPITQEISKAVGLKTSESKTTMTKIGMKTSLQTSLSAFSVFSAELSFEFSTALTTFRENSQLDVEKVTYTAPAGKDYRVTRLETKFIDKKQDGTAMVYFGKKTFIEESDEELPEELPAVN